MNNELTIGSRIKHSQYGEGIICRIGIETFTISFFEKGTKEINRKSDEIEVIEVLEGFSNMVTIEEIEDIFYGMMQRYTDATEPTYISDKWRGGTMILQPKDNTLQSKEIPLDTFFHKIVMVRDRLRVLEQNINSNKNLYDDEKVNIQQYITRIYGSLTTFNVLFKNKEDYFVGESGKGKDE